MCPNILTNHPGSTKTYVDKMTAISAINGRSEAFHQFLRLSQPVDDNAYPHPRVAEAGKTYEFPFTFILPLRLPDGSCRHRTANPLVKDAHLCLPPSFGDPDLAGRGRVLLDDMAPEMAKVSYAVVVRLNRLRESDGKEMTLASKSKKLRIIPAFEEEPPINVDGQDEEYCLRKVKSIRKGMFKGKLGCLVMEANQPTSLRLQAPNSPDAPSPVTTVTVNLRFDPFAPDLPPPRLGQMSSKLKIGTYFASVPRKDFPSKKCTIMDIGQGLHVGVVQLSSRCMESAQWKKHENSSKGSFRRDSAFSITSLDEIPEPSDGYQGETFYTAKLVVPITLPKTKVFVPTFHSCLVSRIYLLDLALSIHQPGVSAPSLQLKVPIQISSEKSAEGRQRSTFAEEAMLAAQQAASFYERTHLEPHESGYYDRAPASIGELPPDYSAYGGTIPVLAH